MTSFFISSEEQQKPKKGLQCYNVEERKLMADILYEEQNSKRSIAKFDSDERRLMAEIARENDMEEKVNQRKNFEEKREQMKQKREEKDAERKAKALMKLQRVESITKPDLVSDTVKHYDTKRADVLDRLKTKDTMRKMRLQKSMSREKPDMVSDVAKKYNERRLDALERIQKKQEDLITNYERKMNRCKSKSTSVKDVTKKIDRILGEDRETSSTDKEGENEGSENEQTQSLKRFAYSKSSARRMTYDVPDDIPDVEDELVTDSKMFPCQSPTSSSDTENGYSTEQTSRTAIRQPRSVSRYNSFDTKTVLPPIECT